MSKESKGLLDIEELIINRNITTENVVFLQGEYRKNILYIIRLKDLLTKSSQIVNKNSRDNMSKLYLKEYVEAIRSNIKLEEKLNDLKRELELIKFVLHLSIGKKHKKKNIDPRT